jgi:hypothetical protein
MGRAALSGVSFMSQETPGKADHPGQEPPPG